MIPIDTYISWRARVCVGWLGVVLIEVADSASCNYFESANCI